MPREPEPSWRDGIRALHPEEFEGLNELVSTVFHPGLVADFPHFLTPENAGDLRVAVVDGKVVSHVGVLKRDASIFGCTVRVAAMGGVATYEAHRGKGYASALFEETVRVGKEDGVDFMLVSGYRKMYHRNGCRYVGQDWTFTVPLDRIEDFDDGKVELVSAGPEDVPAMAEVYRREPVRWMRPPSDFLHGLAGRRLSKAFVLCEQGMLQGYVIVQQPRKGGEGRGKVVEAAGDRRCLVGVLGRLMKELDMKSLEVHAGGWDRPFQDLLKARGLHGEPANADGTVTLINFPQFMERMRPYFTEVVGERVARGLVFRQHGNEMLFYFGGDCVKAPDQGAAVQLIFGTLDGAESALLEAGGCAGEILSEIFPLPALWYGISFL